VILFALVCERLKTKKGDDWMEILTTLDILERLKERSKEIPKDPRRFGYKEGEMIVRRSRFYGFVFWLADIITGGYLYRTIVAQESLCSSIRLWRNFVETKGGYGQLIADQLSDTEKQRYDNK